METTFGQQATQFYKTLKLNGKLPNHVKAMNPYRLPQIMGYVDEFFGQFFGDTKSRIFVFGINPGRFGAGTTGITFTDPVALEEYCFIPNDLPKKRELSSIFIYQFIESWGGAKNFYQDFFLTATSPLGFTKDGKNFNFYDHPKLFGEIKPFVVHSLLSHLAFGARREAAIVLGTGKIKAIFEDLNCHYHFFNKIYVLEHPRFIMQYRRKMLPYYLNKYRRVFLQALELRKHYPATL